jgi:rubrerythrin
MDDETRENLTQAFIGEAKAYFRLRAFAQKADQEGYPQIAALFRAIAMAESVHAERHFELLEKIQSTEENLRYSFKQETFVNQVAYPEFIRKAWDVMDKTAVWAFTLARNAEERHAKLYKEALTHLVADRTTVYFVCTHCGWVEDGTCPSSCPNCQKPGEIFVPVA